MLNFFFSQSGSKDILISSKFIIEEFRFLLLFMKSAVLFLPSRTCLRRCVSAQVGGGLVMNRYVPKMEVTKKTEVSKWEGQALIRSEVCASSVPFLNSEDLFCNT